MNLSQRTGFSFEHRYRDEADMIEVSLSIDDKNGNDDATK